VYRINLALKEIRDVLTAEDAISKQVKYQIKERGENDRRRLTRLFNFSGPDDDTRSVLWNNATEWLQCPGRFWSHPKYANLGTVPIEAQVVGSYIQTKRDDA
jgi:hypothetical protein